MKKDKKNQAQKIDRALSACLPMLRSRPSGIEFTIKKEFYHSQTQSL